jgi:hypothetical protein
MNRLEGRMNDQAVKLDRIAEDHDELEKQVAVLAVSVNAMVETFKAARTAAYMLLVGVVLAVLALMQFGPGAAVVLPPLLWRWWRGR